MANSKKYYWIKLKNDFFDLPAIDWLIGQKNGCEYIVLYQKLCLMASNNGGHLSAKIGEMIIPFDENKISRDTKFDLDTVIVALELFKKLGLIYREEDNCLFVAAVPEMIGSETKWAEKKRLQRSQKKDNSKDNQGTLSNDDKGTLSDKSIEIRDKRLEYRDIELDIESNNARTRAPRTRFIAPSVKEVTVYCQERNNNIDPQRFCDYYESKGWLVGKTKMKDWQAAVRTWENNDFSQPQAASNKSGGVIDQMQEVARLMEERDRKNGII